MNLRIIKAGLLDTVQDMGRYGWQHLGINPGGVMDQLSAQVANMLVGNVINDALIEMHFPASSFFFEQPALIAIAGADFSATINGEEVPLYQPILLSKFSIVQFHKIKNGARAYLAIHGGIGVSKWLNSYSTQAKTGAGGFKGRALQKDDEIPICLIPDPASVLKGKEFLVLPWKAGIDWEENSSRHILVLRGHEYDWLNEGSKYKLENQSFTISNQSDRMGYHLRGKALQVNNHDEVVSSAVNFGTVQLLPNGQLIILMADHQTAGGYPRVAHVISAHQHRLAQMKPGEQLGFRFTTIEHAEQLMIKQQQHLLQLQNACKFKLANFLSW